MYFAECQLLCLFCKRHIMASHRRNSMFLTVEGFFFCMKCMLVCFKLNNEVGLDSSGGGLFVPLTLRSRVVQWGYSSQLPTLAFTWARSLYPDISGGRVCTGTCVTSPTYTQMTLESHSTGLSGLPTSQSNTVILVIVHRFSNAAHFLALSKLPSASETASG